jgi:phospho-N-acetylmuramoyl-pentapeptide-transferase
VLYHLLVPLANTHIVFNLFNYISFRAAAATVTALLVAFICAPPIINRLRQHKVGQVIRAEGPATSSSPSLPRCGWARSGCWTTT